MRKSMRFKRAVTTEAEMLCPSSFLPLETACGAGSYCNFDTGLVLSKIIAMRTESLSELAFHSSQVGIP